MKGKLEEKGKNLIWESCLPTAGITSRVLSKTNGKVACFILDLFCFIIVFSFYVNMSFLKNSLILPHPRDFWGPEVSVEGT